MTDEPRLQNLLGFIETYIAQEGFAPSYREIQTECGYYSTSTIRADLEALREQGAVTWNDRKSRTLRLTKERT